MQALPQSRRSTNCLGYVQIKMISIDRLQSKRTISLCLDSSPDAFYRSGLCWLWRSLWLSFSVVAFASVQTYFSSNKKV